MLSVSIKDRAAFTLIELLVVIAIIAILASILFPVFSAAKSRAMETRCLSNLKQLGTASLMYCDDWQSSLPHPGGSSVIKWAWDQDVYGGIDAYLKSKSPTTNTLWRCPYGKLPHPDAGPAFGRENSLGRSYAMNDYLREYNTGLTFPTGRPYASLKQSRLDNPSHTILIFETWQDNTLEKYAWRNGSPFMTGGADPRYGKPAAMHAGRMNVVFCDGRAASVRPSDTWAAVVNASMLQGRYLPKPEAAPKIAQGGYTGPMPDLWVPFWPYTKYP